MKENARKNTAKHSLRIFQAIQDYQQQHVDSPSLDELAMLCQLSRSAVHRHLQKLTRAGWIVRTPGSYRQITVLRVPVEADVDVE
jgi:DNA-binding IclR family transcriptional regulator